MPRASRESRAAGPRLDRHARQRRNEQQRHLVSRGRTWSTGFRAGLVIEPTDPAWKTHVEMWVELDGDGTSVCLTPDQARQVAAELVRRADELERQSPDGDT